MRLSRNRVATHIGFNMTPMIDIVFLLIIFFMTVSQITRVVDHPLELPVATDGASAETAELTVNLTRAGRILVAEEEYSLPQLLVLVKQLMDQENVPAERMKVRLRCDRSQEAAQANQILRELSEMGVVQVRVGVRGPN